MSTPPKRKPGRPKEPGSKRQQGADRHTEPRKAFHMPPELLAALEKFLAETKPKPTFTASLVTAVEEFLGKRGYWPPK